MKINFTKGIKKIYFLVSGLWVLFMFVAGTGNMYGKTSLIIRLSWAFSPPIIIYFLVNFILDGFKDK